MIKTYKKKIARFYAIVSAVTIILLILGNLFLFSFLGNEQEKTENLKNKIEAMSQFHDNEILKLNNILGISESKLVQQEVLTEKYKNELTKKDAAFEKLRKKHNLDIKSRDELIAELRGSAESGGTVVIGDCGSNPEKPVIKYSWKDRLNRFSLNDDNIFVDGNEQFNYKLKFSIKGEIFSDKNGIIKTRKVSLKEVAGDDNSLVPDSNVEIISNDFIYVDDKQPREKKVLDVFTLRPIATFDIALMPGLGFEILNTGKLVDFANIGLYTKLAADITNPFNGSLQNSRLGIGVNYHVIPPLLKTNFAIGAAINLPFNKLDSPVLTIDAILYLTEDLNPFME
jgi:hypothetical protein